MRGETLRGSRERRTAKRCIYNSNTVCKAYTILCKAYTERLSYIGQEYALLIVPLVCLQQDCLSLCLCPEAAGEGLRDEGVSDAPLLRASGQATTLADEEVAAG